MSKNYIGDSNNVAKKISNGMLVGGVARRAIKGYIGVDGIATPIFSCQNQIVYVGTVEDLSVGVASPAVTTVGNYALFGGGSSSDTVDYYNNNNLIKGTAISLINKRRNLAATTVGNYALFAGGYSVYGSAQSEVDTYDNNLVKGTTSNLRVARYNLAATTVGNYALFGGGIYNYNMDDTNYYSTGTLKNIIDTYDNNLVKGTASNLSVARYNLAATTVGNYALFGGGNSGSAISTVDIYESQLV